MHSSRLIQLQNMLKSSPNDSFLLFALAKEYEKSNDLAEALVHYLALESVEPHYVGLYYHKGKLQERLQQTDQAIDTYIKGVEMALQAKDMHAASELRGALMELEE